MPEATLKRFLSPFNASTRAYQRVTVENVASGKWDLLTFNRDLGCYTFNISAAYTCPGRSEWCARNCYACKGQFVFPSTRGKQAGRLKFAAGNLGRFVASMIAEVSRLNAPKRTKSRRARDGKLIIRVHSAGDFFSPAYVNAWRAIAEACPEVVFFAYTRTWRVDRFGASLAALAELENFHLHASQDPTIEHETSPDWLRKAWTADCTGAGKPNCPKQFDRGDCTTCSRCHGARGNAPVFKVH